jgi:rare lipoprotein A
MRSPRNAALVALGLLAAASGAAARDKPASLPATDPPAMLGEAYVTDGVTYVPADAPFDDVGYAGLDEGVGAGVSVSHRTLPLPSYVEITALDSGRTILARVERRGPASGKQLVALSPSAFAQLGEDSSQPLAVRVRRVNPQEYERALLRTNQRAPERLVTPGPLVEVLRKLLAAKSAPAPVAAVEAGMKADLPAAAPSKRSPSSVASAKSPQAKVAAAAKPALATPPAGKASTVRPETGFSVQAASFASRANADATARKLGGKVSGSGKLWRVQLGPFADKAAAQAGLARAKKAGFSDAHIVSPAR